MVLKFVFVSVPVIEVGKCKKKKKSHLSSGYLDPGPWEQ